MKKDTKTSAQAAELRRRAEERLREKQRSQRFEVRLGFFTFSALLSDKNGRASTPPIGYTSGHNEFRSS